MARIPLCTARLALAVVLAACQGTIAGGGGGDDADAGLPTADADLEADAGAADACTPRSCAATDCELVPDGCGDELDCGPCEPGVEALADVGGCFLEVTGVDSNYEINIGDPGARYEWISIDFDVFHGGWREDVFDRPVLNHGLFGLHRNVSQFVGRYILGNAAQMKPATMGFARRSIFYGRVDLEPRPQGQGYMGYTSWRANMAWVPGETYHVHVVLDAVGKTQTLELSHVGQVVVQSVGDIAYFNPSLSEATYKLGFGGTESDEREVMSFGWRFYDLAVRAKLLSAASEVP